MTDTHEESDNEDWQAREESRTHSVKFSEDSATDKETPFVRQNTPHPKELKAKAHKLFSKDKRDDDSNLHPLSEEVNKKNSFLLKMSHATLGMILKIFTPRWRSFLCYGCVEYSKKKIIIILLRCMINSH